GGVDDVEAVLRQGLVHALPERGGRRGLDGDAALLLLLHPVHGRGAVVDFADLVALARVEQDALGRGGLAGIDVGHDAEVAVTLDGSGAGHGRLSWIAEAALRRPGLQWGARQGAAAGCRQRPALTSGSARRPCWLPPCGGFPRAS